MNNHENSFINKSVESMITNVVTVVLRIHFYYVSNEDLIEDLKQEGYLKAYELLAQGNYDPSKSLRTFIYTGVRNAMTNYMYHHNKESHLDVDDIDGALWQSFKDITKDNFWKGKIFYINEDISDEDFNIEMSLILDTCEKYKMFGDYTNIIINELNDLGIFYLEEKLEENVKSNELIKNTILCEIFWNMFKFY